MPSHDLQAQPEACAECRSWYVTRPGWESAAAHAHSDAQDAAIARAVRAAYGPMPSIGDALRSELKEGKP